MWEKMSIMDQDEDYTLGHSLSLHDLKKVIRKTKEKLKHREYNNMYSKSKADKNSDKVNKKEADDKKIRSLIPYSYQTFPLNEKGKGNQKSEDPVEGDKCPVPGCTKTLSKGKNNHLYIVQCPELKTSKTAPIIDWFQKRNFKCHHCFSKTHRSHHCQFRSFTCRRIVADKYGKQQYCGKGHHLALHDELADGKILPNKPNLNNRQPPRKD